MKQASYLVPMLLVAVLLGGCRNQARITVKVLDDNDQPVANAHIVALGLDTRCEGITDNHGVSRIDFHNAIGQVDFSVQKEGFYAVSWVSYCFQSHRNGKWQPWDPVVILPIRKMGKAVPMVVKQVTAEMPVLEQPVGYDLLSSDWVRPYGKGETADFIFEAKRNSNGPRDVHGWLKLTFLNHEDGLYPVRLFSRNNYGMRLPGLAPTSGYISRCWWGVGKSEHAPDSGWMPETNMDEDANYYFRVRCASPGMGLYGKVYRGISLGLWTYRTNVTVNFLYYLNPDGTRNTEWDTRSNLCPNPGYVGGRP